MSLYSYHMFLFPFQWELNDQKDKSFSCRFDLNAIHRDKSSNWINITDPKTANYETELYNEKNFFYKFVHNILYDNGQTEHPAIKHYERKEAYEQELQYEIGVKATEHNIYSLKCKSIGLDLFSTGTGLLIFYLENTKYPEIQDVKRINQFGRRIFPPFLNNETGADGTKGSELADYIAITGLNGSSSSFFEDFTGYSTGDSWKPAKLIHSLINELDPNITIEPVVDDRMFTMCWYLNNELEKEIKLDPGNKFTTSDSWHKYLFVDSGDSTCQNVDMQESLLKEHTYKRWQKYGTLYGITRYSFMAISGSNPFAENILLTTFRTIYVRIAELVLVQRSSILKFSAEVTKLSTLPGKDTNKLAEDIGDFYKSYIRFVNQVYFREITAQEQGIDLYEMLLKTMSINDQVKDLDNEIGELYNYAASLADKEQSKNLRYLTILGSIFLAPTFIVGFFGMNLFDQINIPDIGPFYTLLSGFILTPLMIYFSIKAKNKYLKPIYLVLAALAFFATFTLFFNLYD